MTIWRVLALVMMAALAARAQLDWQVVTGITLDPLVHAENKFMFGVNLGLFTIIDVALYPVTTILQLALPIIAGANSTMLLSVDPIDLDNYNVLMRTLGLLPNGTVFGYNELIRCTVTYGSGRIMYCAQYYDPIITTAPSELYAWSGKTVYGTNGALYTTYQCDDVTFTCTYTSTIPNTFYDAPDSAVQTYYEGRLLLVRVLNYTEGPSGIAILDCQVAGDPSPGVCYYTATVTSSETTPLDQWGAAFAVSLFNRSDATSGYALYVSAPRAVPLVIESGMVCTLLCGGVDSGFSCTNDTINCVTGPLSGCATQGCNFGAGINSVSATTGQLFVGGTLIENGQGAVAGYNCTSGVICDQKYLTAPSEFNITYFGAQVKASYTMLAATDGKNIVWFTELPPV